MATCSISLRAGAQSAKAALAYGLMKMGLRVERQVSVSLNYKGLHFDKGCRAEFIIEDRVIAEFKSVEKISHVKKIKLIHALLERSSEIDSILEAR